MLVIPLSDIVYPAVFIFLTLLFRQKQNLFEFYITISKFWIGTNLFYFQTLVT